MTLKQKQIRFTVLAILFILLCLGGIYYFRKNGPLVKPEENNPLLGVQTQVEAEPTEHPEYHPYSEGAVSEADAKPVTSNQASREALAMAKQASAAKTVEEEEVRSVFQERASELLSKNGSRTAEVVNRIYTTKRAVAFLFSGLGNSEELSETLATLRLMNTHATFFVTKAEIEEYPNDIKKIVDAGMELGILFRNNEFNTAEAQLTDWLETDDMLRTQFGYQGTIHVKQGYGSVSKNCLIAASAGGYKVISPMLEACTVESVHAVSGQAIIDALFPSGKENLQRGESVHFQMNYLQGGNSVLSEAVRLMACDKSNYPVMTITDILNDEDELYTYPLPERQILPEVSGKIYAGHLSGMDVFGEMQKRYIGTWWVTGKDFLPGFDKKELQQLDTKGHIKNDQNYVFLSFDDWGTDYSIDPLLQVLAKHKVRATFFVRTSSVRYNPNLLRAIAKEGHAIASHTHSHFPLSNMETDVKYTTLTDAQAADLQQDLITSYNELASIVGDMRMPDGKPSLTLLFRPPTLAMSRIGLQTVLDCGFTYSVSGSFSTRDYQATSAAALAKSIKQVTRSGSIMTMHMSENAQYTAEALDIYLTQMEKEHQPFKFVAISDAL